MEPLQKQVITLSHKVDALYQVIEQLNRKVSEALSDSRNGSLETLENDRVVIDAVRYQTRVQNSFSQTLEHKDVLADNTCIDTNPQNSEKQLTPEIQIQRLTAQLTAAYNRIAALEEQLLAQRIHN
jgi:hypothetical protein